MEEGNYCICWGMKNISTGYVSKVGTLLSTWGGTLMRYMGKGETLLGIWGRKDITG